jgi:hypothetical protein
MLGRLTDEERVADFRRRAEELRTVADGMSHADSAAILRRMADQHEAMADRLDNETHMPTAPDPH